MNVRELLLPLFMANQLGNQNLQVVIFDQPAEHFHQASGSELGSVADILNHVLHFDLVWLKRIAGAGFHEAFVAECVGNWNHKTDREPNFESREEWWELRSKIDEAFLYLAGQMKESELNTVIHYTNVEGLARSLKLGAGLLHLSHHQTHHRGAIAQIYDELHIPNSPFSLMQAFAATGQI